VSGIKGMLTNRIPLFGVGVASIAIKATADQIRAFCAALG
jgi:hypothetical protein